MNLSDWSARERLLGLILCLLVILMVILFWITTDPQSTLDKAPPFPVKPKSEVQPQKDQSKAVKPKQIAVDVKGEVGRPGVYYFTGEVRVHQVVNKAGGVTQKADIKQVNLAQPLKDGAMVYIPKQGEKMPNLVNSQPEKENTRINLNTATQKELESLNGVGPSKAKAILQYREENGSFQTVEELTQVPGIGEKTLQGFQEQVTV